jgi:hypothetical protein
MVSAPNLQKLIIREDGRLTNEGFGRLVEAGGGKALQAVALGVLKSRSRPLTKQDSHSGQKSDHAGRS